MKIDKGLAPGALVCPASSLWFDVIYTPDSLSAAALGSTVGVAAVVGGMCIHEHDNFAKEFGTRNPTWRGLPGPRYDHLDFSVWCA